MSEMTPIRTICKAWGSGSPKSNFLNLENLQEKNCWGVGKDLCPALTTPQAGGEDVPEVDRLVVCGVEKQVHKVPWGQLDKSSEGSHYTTNTVFSSQSKLVPEGGVCVRLSR